jgi:hypothetical protein
MDFCVAGLIVLGVVALGGAIFGAWMMWSMRRM